MPSFAPCCRGSTRTPIRRPACANDAPFELGLHGLSEMFVEGFLDLIRAGILKREVDGSLLQAAFFLGLARVLPRAAGDAGRRARQAADDGGLLRQRALWRRAGQAARAGQGALRQQRHDGDAARRRGFGRAGGRPGRQRRRRAIQFRRPGLRARRRPLRHHPALDAASEQTDRSPTSTGPTATPPSRVICATSW